MYYTVWGIAVIRQCLEYASSCFRDSLLLQSILLDCLFRLLHCQRLWLAIFLLLRPIICSVSKVKKLWAQQLFVCLKTLTLITILVYVYMKIYIFICVCVCFDAPPQTADLAIIVNPIQYCQWLSFGFTCRLPD